MWFYGFELGIDKPNMRIGVFHDSLDLIAIKGD